MKNERFTVLSDGIPIVGHLLTSGKEIRPLLVLCHGAPSGAPQEPGDGGYPALAQRFAEQGYAVCWFNFRGTGESGGNIDFAGWTRDLGAVTDFLLEREEVNKNQVFLAGSSAGAATAIYVAAHDRRIAGVISGACPADFSLFLDREPRSIIEGYRQIGAIRDSQFPPSIDDWFGGLLEMTALEHVGRISPRPILFIHGKEDTTVPVAHASRLYEAAGEPKTLVLLENAGHRLRRDERFFRHCLAWLADRTGGDVRKI